MAIPSTMVWEVQTGGNDLNGAGFDSAGSGTDYSQSTSPHVTFDGSTITATTSGSSATITVSGYTVASTDVGNVLNLASGTNFTAGRYHIVSVNTGANSWTLDRTCSSGSGSAMVGRMGGCAQTIGAITNGPAVNRNLIYVKAGTYTITASIALPNGISMRIVGYSSSRGDGGSATVTCSTNSISKFTIGTITTLGAYRIENFIINDTAGTRGACFAPNGAFSTFGPLILKNVTMDGHSNALSQPIGDHTDIRMCNCTVKNCTGIGISTSCKTSRFVDCLFYNNGSHGVQIDNTLGQSYAFSHFLRCTFANNTGAGIKYTSSQNYEERVIEGCNFYSNGSDGLKIDVSALIGASVRNCIFDSNTGYGINVVQTNGYEEAATTGEYNAFYNNSSGQVQRFPNNAAVTLTGSPFVAAGSQNFAPNSTSGAGSSVRAAGFPGVGPAGTGYLDIGALQHADPASGGLRLQDGMRGGF